MPRSCASSLIARCASSASLNSSGRSTFARCAARSIDDDARARDLGGDRLELLRRRRRILGAGDRERRRGDRAERAAQVELAQELAVAHVGLGRRREEHRAEALHVAERRREPARQHGVGDRGHAAARERARCARPRTLASPKRADVHASTSRSSRSGASSASRMPTAPPSERPTNENALGSARVVEHAPREVADVAQLDPSARRRGPGWSTRTTSKPRERRRLRVPHRASSSRASRRERRSVSVSPAVERRARGRRTRPPSRGSPPARARPARSARPRTASRRARFARMRSASTSRPSSVSRSARRRRRVYASASESAFHSACQAPAARSCSCSSVAAARRPRRGRARRTRGRAPAPTGFRLCGIVDDAPSRASRTSPTSVCASSTTSSAIFAAKPAATASAAPSSASGRRRVCHGSTGSGRSSSLRVRVQHLEPAVAERGERPRRAAELRRQARGGEALPRVDDPDEPARRPSARTSSAPPAAAASAPPSPSRGARPRAARTRARRRRARATISASRRARRARPPCRGCPGSSRRDARRSERSRSARTSGSTGLPASRPSRASSLDVETVGGEDVVAELGISRAARRARARARRRASPRATRRRETAARSVAGTKSASKRAKNTVCRSPCRRMSKRSSHRPHSVARRRVGETASSARGGRSASAGA